VRSGVAKLPASRPRHTLSGRIADDRPDFGWPQSRVELERVQRELAQSSPDPWRPARSLTIGGCFVCFPRGPTGPGAAGDPAWAGAALFRQAQAVAIAKAEGRAGGPYEPGLLALREGPLLEAAVRGLPDRPDVLIVDATAADHPRGAGLALHLGVALDMPTIGVTHRPLLAQGPWPADRRGATSVVCLGGRTVGCWLRTRAGARPLVVHPGWRTELDAALEVVVRCTGPVRTPEPLRHARRAARKARARAAA
jgi:deoxyribonuclease V